MGVGTPEDLVEASRAGSTCSTACCPRATRATASSSRARGRLSHPQRALPRRPAPARPRLRLLHLPHGEPRLPAPPAPGGRDDARPPCMTIHNLAFYLDTLRRMRQSIRLGRFEEFRQEMRPSRPRAKDSSSPPSTRPESRRPAPSGDPTILRGHRCSIRASCSPSPAPPSGRAAPLRQPHPHGAHLRHLLLRPHPAHEEQAEEARGAA